MTAQAGKDLLLKLDLDGNGTFTTVAGLRSTQLAFNAQTVDATTIESQGRWRELLAGAGVRTARISGAGIFRDQDTDATARQMFFDGDIRNWRIIIPDFGVVEGPFQLSSLEYAGAHDGEATYEMGLESAGVISFSTL